MTLFAFRGAKSHEWTFCDPIKVEEVIKMMEFLMTMAVIALVFVAATILVALVAKGLLRLKYGIFNLKAKNVSRG